jgi:glycosyl hydrolase family 106( putative alpha-L-rhamnosidase)
MEHAMKIKALILCLVLFAGNSLAAEDSTSSRPSPWPQITEECRPWSYWWWQGSAVDEDNMRRELRRYRDAGWGGLHIVPIYGAQGQEDRYIEYLSPRWLEMLDFTVKEARRLGLGVDMTMGTGWCFGGPHIADRDADAKVVCDRSELKRGQKPRAKIAREMIQAAVAFDPQGKPLELLDKVQDDGTIDWTVPDDGWTLYVVSQKPSGRKVKRAAPGGAGWMLNPFSGRAMRAHAARFDAALADYRGAMPRAFYHDSYEYQCNWADDLFDEFERRRGYRLQAELPSLFGSADVDADRAVRVKADYRRTVSEMMTNNFTRIYVDWARSKGCLTRDQAHGSPGNLLDLYGQNDIPETEFFRFDRNPLVAKFASSATHTMGRRCTSAETATWLDEHFNVTLGHLKPFIDGLFASGINHVFYHGTCYSPDDVAWPGWLFYASTQMNPRNSIWHDVPALNDYIARCQSVLQAGGSDNDLLVYWPIDDLWHDADGLAKTMTVHRTEWIVNQPLGQTARWLWDRGYAFDYVSDHQLQLARVSDGRIVMPGGPYRAVLVPPCEHMPVDTLRKLLGLAHAGATVVFEDRLPDDVPGLGNLEERRKTLQGLLEERLQPHGTGNGKVVVGPLAAITKGLPREPVVDHGTTLVIRRRLDDGRFYFIANQDDQFTPDPKTEPIDGWIALGTLAQDALLMDPISGRVGRAAVRQRNGKTEVYLQLAPCQSIIVRTFTGRDATGPNWKYVEPSGDPVEITGTWSVNFLEGGPELPESFKMDKLGSWTESPDAEAQRFAGTARYTIQFDGPARKSGSWLLDLGRVCESARVRLNGRDLGTVFVQPFSIRVPGDALKPSDNVLEIEVTNLTANRIRDLDRRKVKWRVFHDINLVSIDYKQFDASNWPLADSGLLGPVRLQATDEILAR